MYSTATIAKLKSIAIMLKGKSISLPETSCIRRLSPKKVSCPKRYPPTTPTTAIIENNTKNSMLIILRICFFSKPSIAYKANSLFLFFSKKFVVYVTNIKVNIPTTIAPIAITVGRESCLV